jgi:chromosome segregation ATPase
MSLLLAFGGGGGVAHDAVGVLFAQGALLTGQAQRVALITGGGGASAGRRGRLRGEGWARERDVLEASLQRIAQQEVRVIAQVLAQSERPQAQRIARKLIDYTGEVAQIASLRRELAKLEAAQQERSEANRTRQQYDADVQAAAAELRAVLRDDDDVIAALQAAQEADIRAVLGILGLTIH